MLTVVHLIVPLETGERGSPWALLAYLVVNYLCTLVVDAEEEVMPLRVPQSVALPMEE